MLVDPLETVRVVKNNVSWKSSNLSLPKGRKLTLTTKCPEKETLTIVF